MMAKGLSTFNTKKHDAGVVVRGPSCSRCAFFFFCVVMRLADDAADDQSINKSNGSQIEQSIVAIDRVDSMGWGSEAARKDGSCCAQSMGLIAKMVPRFLRSILCV